MTTWIVEIGFKFLIRSEDDPISNKEISTCLVGRITAGGLQADRFNVKRGKDRGLDFLDLGGLGG